MNRFFALEIPLAIRQSIFDLSAAWRQHLPAGFKARWYGPSDYHLTIKFLGPERAESIEALTDDVACEVSCLEPFPVALEPRIGAFPNLRSARVIWVAAAVSPAMTHVAHTVDRISQRHGWIADQRAFHPHITVARVRDTRAKLDLSSWERPFGTWCAEQLVLMQSCPPPMTGAIGGAARYNVVRTFPFGLAGSEHLP